MFHTKYLVHNDTPAQPLARQILNITYVLHAQQGMSAGQVRWLMGPASSSGGHSIKHRQAWLWAEHIENTQAWLLAEHMENTHASR